MFLRRFEFCELLHEQCSPEAVEVADDLNATEGGLAFVQESLLVQRLDVVELILIDDLLTARAEVLEAVQAAQGVRAILDGGAERRAIRRQFHG